MVDLIRNIIALLCTFTVISVGSMIIMHGCITVLTHKKQLSMKQERILVYCGIALALALIPFYNLPC